MARKINWGRTTCPHCRDRITKNALGRAAHIRHCTGVPKPDKEYPRSHRTPSRPPQ